MDLEKSKKCKYCKMEIPRDAKICPYCHKKQSYRSRITPSVLLISIFIVLIIALYSWVYSIFHPASASLVTNPQTIHTAQTVTHSILSMFM